ncbi:hypothetical protein EN788_27565 [Mesorhizobium sp. M2D.F.Ca.ET.145.01.1.1]|nr:hypothetical protein EN792_054240 [Mesorhizobium sp. M00.F.Ca.ET.149.01.1.1]TGW09034.1 hypothetical protein EN788_27565 [Mesorhizobium sp. M2D.F.Ca.ET.145.01.1.1]
MLPVSAINNVSFAQHSEFLAYSIGSNSHETLHSHHFEAFWELTIKHRPKGQLALIGQQRNTNA